MAETAFTYTHDGSEHQGWYELRARMVRVRTTFGSRATQLGSTPELTLAKMLAGELAREAR